MSSSSRTGTALTAAAPVAALRGDDGPRRGSFASAAPAPRRVPSRAGTHASKIVDAAIAASARSTHSSQAGRSRHRKNFLVMTLAAVMGNPGYEAGARAAEYLGAKVYRVALRKDYSHDVQ